MTDFASLLAIALSGRELSQAEMRAAMDLLLAGGEPDDDVAQFLLALKARGETVGEIVAAAQAMRARALAVKAPDRALDTCGTGGDGAETFNISTAAALIVAGAGAPVAKHGNRAASSKSGSSDILSVLGVNLTPPPAIAERCIAEANIGFMFAAYHHRAVGHVAAVRKKLGVRTLFNLLGPLANPAGAKRQLMGVFDKSLIEPLARALLDLGADHVWTVHGGDGLDELTTTGESFVCEGKNGEVRCFTVTPEDAGLPRARAEDLKGGTPEENAAALMSLLDGEAGPYRDIAVLNAAAALIVAGKAHDLKHGAALAAQSIDSGAAKDALARLVRISNEGAP